MLLVRQEPAARKKLGQCRVERRSKKTSVISREVIGTAKWESTEEVKA